MVLDDSRRSCTWCRQIRDEAHRFAVTFHRTRRNASPSDLGATARFPGVGERTLTKLLRDVRQPGAGPAKPRKTQLARVVGSRRRPDACAKISIRGSQFMLTNGLTPASD